MATNPYHLENPNAIESPALLVFRELVANNIAAMVRMAGDAARLRPHCKTHKTPQVAAMQMAAGVTKFKCATLAEAEMLASAGARDILLAYQPVGPAVGRVAQFLADWPDVALSVLVDHSRPLAQLNAELARRGRSVEVLLDIDPGMGRSGIPAGDAAFELYQQVAAAEKLTAGGLHHYDGQHRQSSLDARRAAVLESYASTHELAQRLRAAGLAVPRVVVGGSGSFPVFAELDDDGLELSPGTVVFYDAGYGELFPDLPFTPAAVVLTRVVSKPGSNRLTLDVGYKAVAGDPPAGSRVRIVELPEAREVMHSEEHLVIESAEAEKYEPGDVLLAIPIHVCPTVSLYDRLQIVEDGRLTETWPVTARTRLRANV